MEKKKVIDYVIFGVLCLGIVLVTISLFLPFVAVESFIVSSLKEIFANVGQKLSFDDKLVVRWCTAPTVTYPYNEIYINKLIIDTF